MPPEDEAREGFFLLFAGKFQGGTDAKLHTRWLAVRDAGIEFEQAGQLAGHAEGQNARRIRCNGVMLQPADGSQAQLRFMRRRQIANLAACQPGQRQIQLGMQRLLPFRMLHILFVLVQDMQVCVHFAAAALQGTAEVPRQGNASLPDHAGGGNIAHETTDRSEKKRLYRHVLVFSARRTKLGLSPSRDLPIMLPRLLSIPLCLCLASLAITPSAVASDPHATSKAPKKAATHSKAKTHSADPHGGAVHWGYEGAGGPENWAKLDPANALCATGQQQSPIDVRTTYALALDPLVFQYRPSKLSVLNNGHTIQHGVDPGSFLEVGGDRYQLLQFHFHTPSEEAVGGKRYPMVAHLVHKNDAGQLAVVAVFLTQGTASNPFFDMLWEKLPAEHNVSMSFEGKTYTASDILPRDQRYWTLMGSLTTPPCSEGVRWFILKTPVAISKKQLAKFQHEFSMNARPLQPLYQRAILDAQ